MNKMVRSQKSQVRSTRRKGFYTPSFTTHLKGSNLLPSCWSSWRWVLAAPCKVSNRLPARWISWCSALYSQTWWCSGSLAHLLLPLRLDRTCEIDWALKPITYLLWPLYFSKRSIWAISMSRNIFSLLKNRYIYFQKYRFCPTNFCAWEYKGAQTVEQSTAILWL